MAYIVFVNPSILREAGMPFVLAVAATCLCAAFGSILMGVFLRAIRPPSRPAWGSMPTSLTPW